MQADGWLHQDGYFTWKKRDTAYLLDTKLPAEFVLLTNVQGRKPRAYLRVSNISGETRGVFEANPDGSAPDVELKTESLVALYA